MEPSFSLVSDCLNDCTALSASPLDEGWYGEKGMCLIPFCLRYLWNSVLVKLRPLSVTKQKVGQTKQICYEVLR